MSRKYKEPVMPNRGWKDWFMGPGEGTLEFEKSLKEQSLQRHIDLLEQDMSLLCKQIKSRSTELNKYMRYLLSQLKRYGDWTWEKDKYPQPEYVRKAREEFILFYETEFTPTFELLTSAIDEYKRSSGGGGRYKNVIKEYQQCIDKIKDEGQKHIESLMDLEDKSIKERDRKAKEQKNVPASTSHVFGDFEQKYVKEKPKTPKPKPKTPKPKKTIKKTTNVTTLVPSQYFRDQVKKYLKKDMTKPKANEKEIKKTWQKLGLHIHAGSTRYNKLSKAEQDEADEIFKRVTDEKDDLCGTKKIFIADPTWKKSGKGKKTKKGKKGKKVRNPNLK